jgi:hypothetical protein
LRNRVNTHREPPRTLAAILVAKSYPFRFYSRSLQSVGPLVRWFYISGKRVVQVEAQFAGVSVWALWAVEHALVFAEDQASREHVMKSLLTGR